MAIDLERIEDRFRRSTQGLWGSCLSSRFPRRWAVVCPSLNPHDISIADNLSDANSAFIAFAHGEDIPVLVAEVMRLRVVIEDALEQLTGFGAVDAFEILAAALDDNKEA